MKIRIILKEMKMEEKPIRFDEEVLHRILYTYKKRYPKLLKEFSFSLSGTYPYSQLLERILIRAKISRTLKTTNPDFEEVQLSKNTSLYVEERIETEFLEEYSKSDLDILKNIGKDIKRTLAEA